MLVESPSKGSQEQQSQDGSSQSHSWYPPSVVSSPTSSRPVTPTASSSSLSQRPSSHVPPSKAVAVIAILKDKSVDELQKFLSDKDAYQQFLHSLDQVNIQTNNKVAKFPILWTPAHLRHSDVVIAAITSCINTSNPSVMLGAALVAKKACELGLQAIQFGAVKDELNRPTIKVKNSLIFNAFVLCQQPVHNAACCLLVTLMERTLDRTCDTMEANPPIARDSSRQKLFQENNNDGDCTWNSLVVDDRWWMDGRWWLDDNFQHVFLSLLEILQ
ncbi:hypothetical protein JHK82_055737 [Glycine max]|nr:hypothetical protein JHK82_055737 [Glycine max]